MTQKTDAELAAEKELTEKELMGRVEEFNKELVPLLGKYELGLGASAFMNANGTIGARPIMFDARKKPEEAGAPTGEGAQAPAGPLTAAE
jgi:hypothetical protein